ncbi:MAG: CoA transferase [Salinarimonas sp.]|nr:CoA transferase [Salinarimonas sp.]
MEIEVTKRFAKEIEEALGTDMTPAVEVNESSPAELPSCFAMSDLAVSSIRSAAAELAEIVGAQTVALDCRMALQWFGMTLRPINWELPSAWDPVAGDYKTADGWIRLHTNAPHHREAALRVLGCKADKGIVAGATRGWKRSELEQAIVAEGGAAAAMHGLTEWAEHPQGRAVAAEPLIAWREVGKASGPVRLAGLRVLDMTRVLAGPVATRFLAGFGAQVLRIDPPWWSEPGIEPEVTVGKRRAGLNLRIKADCQIFEALLARADVLVHGYRPGALERLGYGEDQLRRLAPELIDVSLSAYGWTGPWAGRRGFDSLVQMSCGIADEGMRRMGGERPVSLPVQALDHATGYLIAATVLRALRIRRATGRIFSGRLSLARTAALLIRQGARDFMGDGLEDRAEDLVPEIEETDWGPAQRLRFPVFIDGRGPVWQPPAGVLRGDPPEWKR